MESSATLTDTPRAKRKLPPPAPASDEIRIASGNGGGGVSHRRYKNTSSPANASIVASRFRRYSQVVKLAQNLGNISRTTSEHEMPRKLPTSQNRAASTYFRSTKKSDTSAVIEREKQTHLDKSSDDNFKKTLPQNKSFAVTNFRLVFPAARWIGSKANFVRTNFVRSSVDCDSPCPAVRYAIVGFTPNCSRPSSCGCGFIAKFFTSQGGREDRSPAIDVQTSGVLKMCILNVGRGAFPRR